MTLNTLDLVVIVLFFLSMVVIGILSYFRSKNSEDYFVAGGLLTFVISKQVNFDSLALEVGLPTMVAAALFMLTGLATRKVPEKVNQLVAALKLPSDQSKSYAGKNV